MTNKTHYMISSTQKFKMALLLFMSATIFLLSCNKNVEQFAEPPVTPPGTGLTLGETLAGTATDSLYYRLVVQGGMLPVISDKAASYTLFVPNNNAMKGFIYAISGGLVPLAAPDAVFSGFISANIPPATAAGIVGYNIVAQSLPSASIPATFPNFQYPTILNPAPAVSALLRLTTFPTTRNGAWVNNVPLIAVDAMAVNGLIHHTAAVVVPPQHFLWDRINTDTKLTYLKAAIIRADSGTAAPGTLQGALLNIGANLTVFAPTDSAFKAIITAVAYKTLLPLVVQQLTAAYVNAGVPPTDAAALAAANAPAITITKATALASSPTVFSNPALFGVLTAQLVKGIVVYHIMGNRAFTNNFPTTATAYPTLLNRAIPAHPGITLTAVFGFPFVSSATVKGAVNATASNIIINASPLLPDPVGTSDQHYLNGVLHKIDQVLLPLPF